MMAQARAAEDARRFQAEAAQLAEVEFGHVAARGAVSPLAGPIVEYRYRASHFDDVLCVDGDSAASKSGYDAEQLLINVDGKQGVKLICGFCHGVPRAAPALLKSCGSVHLVCTYCATEAVRIDRSGKPKYVNLYPPSF